MTALLNLRVGFSTVSCAYENCQQEFALPDNMIKHFKASKKTFYCPYCKGSQGYYDHKSEAEKLKERLEAEQRTNKFLRKQNEAERNRTRAQKAAKTRLKNRVKNGVCPCCNRTFKQLAAHMKAMHPEYVEGKKK